MALTASALDTLVADLRAVLGDRVSTAAAVRDHHSHGESWHAPAPPDAVAFPENTAEVSRVVAVCAAHGVPIVPYGIGSSLEGHVNAVRGGVSIDLTRMTRVLRLSPDDMDVTVEAGLTHRKLNEALKNTGLMFMVDPGADATIGGMAATRASGTAAVRYGTMRETVLGLTVVLADGRVIQTGGRARKSSSGYDLTRLFVGSEGTLGVITEVTLRLYGRPEAISTAVCGFQSMEGAATTVIETIQLGVPVARIEIIDEAQLAIVNRFSKTAFPEVPTLFFEFHGPSQVSVEEQARLVREVADSHGATSFQWTSSPEERAKLWEARHNVLYATIASRPGCKAWTTDICVPIAHLAECIVATQADLRASKLTAPLVGHAGDGNFHLIFMLDPDDPDELARVSAANHRLVERALSYGGTCSGEHGVGFGKLKYVAREHGDAVAVMRDVKRALDPRGLMNPGKLVPGGVTGGADVEQYLAALGIPFARHEHPPVATVAEAETHWAGIDALHAKNLFLRNQKGTRHFLVVLAFTRRGDLAALGELFGERKLGFASPERLQAHLGLAPGSVSPFGLINDAARHVEVAIDGAIRDAARVAFHPNVNTATLVLSGADFLRYLAAVGHQVRWV